MISVQNALKHVKSHRAALCHEQISIEDGLGRVLAEDVISPLNMPPFPAANMDGYAVSSCEPMQRLKIIGDAAAGHPFAGHLNQGEAVRISTGARVPTGANRILIKENTDAKSDEVSVKIASRKDAHIRPPGSDFKTGDVLLKAGQILNAAQLTICAVAGLTNLKAIKKLRLALISCGDELSPPGSALKAGQIYAANSVGLKALLESWGVEVSLYGPVKDTADCLTNVISEVSDFDVIVPIGGASVGDYDLMRPSFKAAGFDLLFESVALRPGKPCWMGRKETQIVFGLPGNPASTFVCAQIFLRALLGLERPVLSAYLTQPIEENGPRETYLRATVEIRNGEIFAAPLAHQDSYRYRPQSEATALIKLPPMGGPYRSGDKLEILLLGDLAQTKCS